MLLAHQLRSLDLLPRLRGRPQFPPPLVPRLSASRPSFRHRGRICHHQVKVHPRLRMSWSCDHYVLAPSDLFLEFIVPTKRAVLKLRTSTA